jgi:uncharacterized membrane protein YidH (DUF202 family)
LDISNGSSDNNNSNSIISVRSNIAGGSTVLPNPILVSNTGIRRSRDKGHIRFSEEEAAEMGIVPAQQQQQQQRQQQQRQQQMQQRSPRGSGHSGAKGSGSAFNYDDAYGGGDQVDGPDLTSVVAPQSDFKGQSFQKQIIKFQRILTHLVNERTVLAWFRVCLSFVTIAIKFMKLGQVYMDYNTRVTSTLLLLCGGLYVFILPHTWFTGFQRYRRCKEMIDFDMTQLSGYLHKMGFNADIASLAVLIGISFVSLCVSGTYIIWMSDGSHTYD